MPERAAIVTGASSGIGFAIARMLLEEGYGLTLAARRPDKLEEAAAELGGDGGELIHVVANVASEDDVRNVVAAHRGRFGRVDVLANNAGVGIGAPVGEIETKRLDMQLDVNLRAMVLFYRECAEMLRQAGAEHHNALVVNTASIAGKSGDAWVSVYSATKAGMIGFTQSMNKELGNDGIKSCALCPAFVDTKMADWVKGHIPAEQMIRPEDVSEAVRMLLRLSPGCVIPEIVFQPPSATLGGIPVTI
jgi:NAD(P)-dependent dehydrogenase (short-subunit alcohol dehydrogenase family)